MTTVYLVRHGESLSNIEGTLTGQLDIELSETGKKQAELVRKYFQNVEVDVIYSSDLIRAVDTVKGVAKDKGLTVNKTKNFREIYGGFWEGKTFDYLFNYSSEYKVWKKDIANAVAPEGESIKQVYERVNVELDKIVKENSGKTIIIGTHATPVNTVIARVKFNDYSGMSKIEWTPNCSITKIAYDGGKYLLEKVGDTSHLKGMITKLPKTV